MENSQDGFKSENKPIGSWLLCGPSGTGKTELAKGITEVLFGNENKMIRFDMSEFVEKHSISKLIGSPPGYVGYGDKGLLTESVYKQPTCLLLFDEIEKAHPDILNIMLQILDDGRLTDSTGKVINFSNTLIVFTSNLGCPKNISDFKKEVTFNFINYKINEQNIMKSIKQYFRPELINRIQDILIFQPLEFKVLLLILNKFIKQFIEQLKLQKFPIKLIIQENLKKYIVKLSISPLYGARPLKRIFDELIVEPTIQTLKIKASANFVPAAAVIREMQALFGIIGRKG
ncbi:chaperone protein ClpB-like, partial [Dipodomys spectabilis]|uniref:chaperone protein ClpB-like n=1 Tax=Dipodomys spectabilis TaxID=105255 RepID=UPI001C540255